MSEKWKALKKLRITTPSSPSPLQHFSADVLNQHFTTVVSTATPLSDTEFFSILDSERSASRIPLFDFHRVTLTEAQSYIQKAPSKAAGIDGLSVPMLKLALPALLGPLTDICNHSLQTSTFPSIWKRTLISPVLKTKSPVSPSDTRPIALLSELSKVLERAVNSQLSAHIESNALLYHSQAAYRSGHSTQTALLRLTDDVRKAVDEYKLTILVLFDLSKAFDSIPHNRLIMKLRDLNLSNDALKWFHSYLKDRSQAVADGEGGTSSWLKVSCGVPQGSILGSPLFSIYINDLPKVLKHSKCILYADDSQIYHHCTLSDIEAGIQRVSQDAQATADWATENELKINLAKSKVMILGSDKYIKNLDLSSLPPISVNGINLEYVSEAKNLGITLSSTLDFVTHSKTVVSKVHRSLFSLNHFRHSLSKQLRVQLVQSLIFPIFDYAAAVYLRVDTTRNKKLQTAQNACIRFVIGNIPFDAHVTPYRLQLGWLSVQRRREHLTGSLAYKIIATSTPDYLFNHFCRLNQDVTQRRSKRNSSGVLVYSTPRTTAMQNSFVVQASTILNSLGIVEFNLLGNEAAKNSIKKTLFSRDIADWNTRIVNENLHFPILPLEQ